MARTSGPDGGDLLLRSLTFSTQRQQVMWCLTECSGETTVDELVDALSDGPERAFTAVRLHHVHLPKLETVGALEWDFETGTVAVTPRGRRTFDSLRRSGEFQRPTLEFD